MSSSLLPTSPLRYARQPRAGEPLLGAARWSDVLPLWVDRHRWAIFTGVFVVYLIGFNGLWGPEPDSALYLTIGRNLAEGLGYTYQGQSHHLAYPGLPWLWAAVFAIVGPAKPGRAVFVADATMVAIGLATLALTYRLILLHAGRPTAVIVTLGTALSRCFYRYSFELRSDMPFLLGVMAFLVGYEALFHTGKGATTAQREADAPPPARARWFDPVLLVLGLATAVVMRPAMWALLIAISVAVARRVVRAGVRWWLAVGVAALVIAAVVLQSLHFRMTDSMALSAYEQGLLDATRTSQFWSDMVHNHLPALFDPAAGEGMFGLQAGLRIVHGVSLSSLLSIVAIGVGISLLWRRPLWGAYYIATVAMLVAAVGPLERYFLAVLPLAVFGWWRLLQSVNHRIREAAWANVAFAFLLAFGATTNGAKVGEWVYNQHQRPFLDHFRGGKYAICPRMGEQIANKTPAEPPPLRSANDLSDTVWVVCPHKYGRILTFYSRRYVVDAPAGVPALSARALSHVYVIDPDDANVRSWLEASRLAPGPALRSPLTIGSNTWTLHQVHASSAS